MMNFITPKRLIVVVVGMAIVLFTLVLSYHEVDNSLTPEDIQYITKYLEENNIAPLKATRSFIEELNFIVQIQNAVLKIAPANDGLPYNTKREPKDLYMAKSGLCYDRSRVIEKILRRSGFKTRHIYMISTKRTGGSALKALMTPKISSHAVTEVLSSKGWLVVDSNNPWVSVDDKNTPLSIKRIKSALGTNSISWRTPPLGKIYNAPFAFVYGLYSRHGRFYPPYGFWPDVNYAELMQNLW